jgi:hypothetical protein
MASTPTPAQLKNANMAAIPNLPAIVVESGDHVRVWDEKTETFPLAPADTPYTTTLYAVPDSWIAQETEEPELYLGGSALGGSDL